MGTLAEALLQIIDNERYTPRLRHTNNTPADQVSESAIVQPYMAKEEHGLWVPRHLLEVLLAGPALDEETRGQITLALSDQETQHAINIANIEQKWGAVAAKLLGYLGIGSSDMPTAETLFSNMQRHLEADAVWFAVPQGAGKHWYWSGINGLDGIAIHDVTIAPNGLAYVLKIDSDGDQVEIRAPAGFYKRAQLPKLPGT